MERAAGLERMSLGLSHRAQVDFAQEALRALAGDHGDGVSYIARVEDFRRVFRAAAGKFRGHAARAYGAHPNAVSAEVFGHAPAQALQRPFGGAVESTADERVFAGKGRDIDDVARFLLDHAGDDRAGDQEHAFQIGV